MKFLKKYIWGVVLLQLLNTSCAKIDEFGKPKMLEGYTGACTVSPGIEDITAKSYTPCLVFFNGNKEGSDVVMYGPNTENFSLYKVLPKIDEEDGKDGKKKDLQFFFEQKGIHKMDKLDFSGFRGKVASADGKKIKFYGFGDQSGGMKKFEWKVTGEGVMAGPDVRFTITIATTVGTLQKMMPDQILQMLTCPDANTSLIDCENKTAMLPLAKIDGVVQSLTFGY